MAKKDTFQQWTEDGEAEEMLALIQSLSMQGYTIENIAKELGIAEKTLHNLKDKYVTVNTAIKRGRRSVTALLQNKLIEKIQEGDTTAILYGLKIYGGDFFKNDRPTLQAEITGKGGGPIDVDFAPQIYLPQKDGDSDA